jgi:hypothetical protein
MSSTVTPAPPTSPVAVLHQTRERLAGLLETLWAAKTPAELLATATGLERLRSALDAVQLHVLAEIDATGAARTEGWSSTKDFYTAVSGTRPGTGRSVMALARAVTGRPAGTGAALADGRISRTQAEVIIGCLDRLPVNPRLRAAAEDLLIDEAGTRPAADLARTGGYVLDRLDPTGTERRDERGLHREERAAHLGRFLSLAEDGIGGVRLTGRGTVEDAALVKKVLMALSAPQATEPGACGGRPTDRVGACGMTDCAHDGRDPREHGTRMWDALVDATRLLTDTEVLPEAHGTKPRLVITLDYLTLATEIAKPGHGGHAHTGHEHGGHRHGELDTGEILSAAAVRRLACDADVLPVVLGTKSQILDAGRTSRLVTHGLWLGLVTRDRHCAFPGCTRPPVACDAHHIVHWVDGGTTALDNLVLLCRHHHTIVHTTPWQVGINPDDHHPEFLPPARLDPHRRPIRRRPLRE